MTVKIRKVSEEDIQARRKQVKEQESLGTAEVDSAVDEGVNSPAATEDQDWQEYEQPDDSQSTHWEVAGKPRSDTTHHVNTARCKKLVP